jgi:hypothetical protein
LLVCIKIIKKEGDRVSESSDHANVEENLDRIIEQTAQYRGDLKQLFQGGISSTIVQIIALLNDASIRRFGSMGCIAWCISLKEL